MYNQDQKPKWNNNYNSNNGNASGSASGNASGSKWQGNKFNKQPPIDIDDVKLYKPYVGTGNKEAPSEILVQMKRLTKELECFGFTLRTGGMEGPDEAFESVATNIELHLPWKDFNNKASKFTFNTPEANGVAKMHHPAYDGLKPFIQAFLAKNARLVMGKDMKSRAMFVICWSEDGAETTSEKTSRTGNVGHIIAIACSSKIPVFNLGKRDAEERLKKYLGIENHGQTSIQEI